MKKIFIAILPLFFSFTAFSQATLDKAVLDGRVDSVWNAYDLPHGFNGEGVIIGVTDWGFDYTHPVFYDTNMISYRVLRAWDQFKAEGQAPEGFDYGAEYVGAEALLQAKCDTSNCYDFDYHGTHCASIAAGGGAGTVYRGVAFGANLLFCSILLDDVHYVIDAWRWMYNVAQQEGKRLVISMSWGVYFLDNMDGTGVLAEEVRRLSDLGVVFISSADNNGDERFHIGYSFTERDTTGSMFAFPYDNGYLWGSSITMTNSANSPFEFSLKVMNNNGSILAETPFITTANNDGYVDSFLVVNNDTLIFNYSIISSSEYNQAPTVRLRVKRNNSYKFGIEVTAESGEFHAWNLAEITKAYGNWGGAFSSSPAHPTWISGDMQHGIGVPANIPEVLAIAAHVKGFVTSTGYHVGGNIADFSSFGPGLHGEMKPAVSAPGKNIVSAISSYTDSYSGTYTKTIEFNGRSYKFAQLSGTSMSCPFAAGVAALVLQANPYLSSEQVRGILMETAYNDSFTASAGPERFGYGKVDAYHAVLRALNLVGVQDHQCATATHYTVFPNPASEQVFITAQTEADQIQCTIFDLAGRMVVNETLHSGVNTLNINHLPDGCYLLRFNDGHLTHTQKLIKQ